MTKKKLLFVVPHSLFGEGLINILAATGRYEISDQPDILLVDASMMQRENIDAYPNAKIIVIGRKSIPSMSDIAKMVEIGARAYVRDTTSSAMLYDIIDLVFDGNTIWPAEVLEGLRNTPFQLEVVKLSAPKLDYLHTLTPREYQLMNYLSEGLSNKVIALRSNIAEATVKVHIKAILRKLRLQNRTQLAVWVVNNTPRSNGHAA
jgi:two-component system, NarL family, nitrate/nitrite response regulator NarL